MLAVIAVVTVILSVSVNAQNTFPSSGNVGVGTTTPDYKLHIKDGTGGAQLKFQRGIGLATIDQDFNVSDLYISAPDGLLLNVFGGNVGIGTHAPDYKLPIKDGIGGAQLKFQRGTGLATINQDFNVSDLYISAPAGLLLNAFGGKVGVGTATPAQQLHIANDGGSGGTYLYVQDLNATNAGGIYVGSYQGNSLIQTGAAGKAIAFWDYTGEKMRIASGGNVGINTINPLAKLQVQNGSVLFDGPFVGAIGATPVSGAGVRMMWIPAKAAFRAGIVIGAWDDANIGYASFASGNDTKASGVTSSAMGYATIASGVLSFAAGSETSASGQVSTAFGLGTTAQSYNSFVLGAYNYNPGTYNSTTWVATDPLLAIGNGTGPSARSNAVTVFKNGNVLIGNPATVTTPAGYKLYVEQGILTEKLKVGIKSGANWSDYVFSKNYKLIPLEELERFVQKNKHLPNIPSGDEMVKDGLDVAAMDAKLLEKIEELTLYIIDLNKRLSRFEKNAKE